MIGHYKEIFFGLLLGLAMWAADALMHTMMPPGSSEQQSALAEEIFSPEGPPLMIRLLYVSFAFVVGWALWRSNRQERVVLESECKGMTFQERIANPTTSILDRCNTLLRTSGLTGEALDIVKEIRNQAQQIDDFTKTFPPLLLIPGRNAVVRNSDWQRLFSRMPGLVSASEYADVLLGIVYEGWGDRRRRFDRAHQRVWNYDVLVERERYARILQAARKHSEPDSFGEVLEVGCAQGIFTMELARYCLSLTACDISPLACEKAAERCKPYAHVRIEQIDLTREKLSGQFDMVFALDLLEAMHGCLRVTDAADKLLQAVRPGGLLIFSGSRLPERMRDSWWSRRLIEGGDNHLACLLGRVDVRLVHRELYPEVGCEIPAYPQHLIAVIQKTTEWYGG
ncbi:MAG: methyltransferase [Acidobacteria bacterium]|nr:methyltransferase [Acidobacteriota bacterium]